MAVTYTPIYTQTVGASNAQAIYFYNIPQNYTDLKVVCSARSITTGGFDSFSVYFNGSQSNISNTFLGGNGSSAITSRSTYRAIATLNSQSSVSNTFTSIEIYIPNYTALSSKQMLIDSVTANNQSSTIVEMVSQLWSQNAPITQLHFDTSTSGQPFQQNSTFSLYGVTRFGT
jgi:hypothetical protein